MRMDAIYNASYSNTKYIVVKNINVVYQRSFIFLLIIAQLYL